MTDLVNLQDRFQNYLLKGQVGIQQSIVNPEKVSAAKRLDIYLDAYRTRLIEALASNYPILKIYLGSELFQKIANEYLQQHPSSYRSIRWFGDMLADFLSNYEGDNHPYLAEFAQFEWSLALTFDAADAEVIKMEQMATIPAEAWGSMQLIPHPSLHRINLFWNVIPIWQAISEERLADELVKNVKPAPWVMWRRDYVSRFYSLAEDESWAMDAMIKGLNFGEICTGLCEWVDEQEVGLRAASFLKGWIQSGLISKIKI